MSNRPDMVRVNQDSDGRPKADFDIDEIGAIIDLDQQCDVVSGLPKKS